MCNQYPKRYIAPQNIYTKNLSKSINFCMVLGTTVNTADMQAGQ